MKHNPKNAFKVFDKYTAEEVGQLIGDKIDFSFTVPISITNHIQQHLAKNVRTLIPIFGVSKEILIEVHFSGNSDKENLDTVVAYTSYQKGRIYFTYTSNTDCLVEIEY